MYKIKRLIDILAGLFAIAIGVYIYWGGAQTDNRFEQETVQTAQASPASRQYTETRRRYGMKTYATDLRFQTESGQPVVLRDTDISKEELEKLQQGQTIPREYLVAEPQIAREPGKTEPKWPIAIFAVVGLMIMFFGLGWKEKKPQQQAA